MLNCKKIIVIGCSGSGKTTFSTQLAEVIKIPLYYLDGIYWQADGTHLPRHAFVKKQKEIIERDEWIIDGNYRNTLEMRISQADLIFFFDIPAEDCLSGVINRVKNKEPRPDLPCALPVNDELLHFVKNFNTDVKPLIFAYFEKYRKRDVITFHSRKEADNYLQALRNAEKGRNDTYGYDN